MDSKACFVIMPFSKTSESHTEEYWNAFYATIRREVESQGYTCNRSETGPYNLVTKIIDGITNSCFVIAVLTDLNPNVWYELGIRHSLRNGTLMLLEKGQKIPFDISSYGLVMYEDNISLSITLKEAMESYITKLDESAHLDSPVLEYFKSQNLTNPNVAKQESSAENFVLKQGFRVFIFGTNGVGKTTVSRLLARKLNVQTIIETNTLRETLNVMHWRLP